MSNYSQCSIRITHRLSNENEAQIVFIVFNDSCRISLYRRSNLDEFRVKLFEVMYKKNKKKTNWFKRVINRFLL